MDGLLVGRDCASEARLAKFSVVDDANRAMVRFISKTTAQFGDLCGAGIGAGKRDIDQFGAPDDDPSGP